MYQCSKKLVKYKEYSCFDHSADFPVHSMFTFDVWWGSLGTRLFENSSSAPQLILDPDYLPGDFSVSYDYGWNKGLQPYRNNTESQSTSVYFSLPTDVRGIQCVFNNKKTKNTWTTSSCKTWESWITCITFSTNSTLQMFL